MKLHRLDIKPDLWDSEGWRDAIFEEWNNSNPHGFADELETQFWLHPQHIGAVAIRMAVVNRVKSRPESSENMQGYNRYWVQRLRKRHDTKNAIVLFGAIITFVEHYAREWEFKGMIWDYPGTASKENLVAYKRPSYTKTLRELYEQ